MKVPERVYAGAVVAAGVVVLVVVLRYGGAIEPEIPGLPTAGPVTVWGLPLVRLFSDGCALACVGTLTAACLAPAGSPEGGRCARAAGWWALGWACTAALGYLATLSDLIPLPVVNLLASPDMLEFGLSIPQTQALLLVVGVALVVAVSAGAPVRARLAVAAFGLLPPAYVGHAASAGDHDLAISALMAHLVPVSVWVGGLAAVLVHFRRSPDLPVVLPRFSAVALCCFAAVTVSGVASAWVRLGTPSDLWRSGYGQLLLAKAAALVLLGLFGWNHRRHTVAGVADRGVRRTFVRLAIGEVTVMAAAVGLAVGLSRTPPPPGGGGGHDHLVLEYALAPFSPAALVTEVRLDPALLLLLALAAAGYGAGVRRVPGWPASRTLAFSAGLALAALVLLGGVAGYARAMLSVHALQHAVLTVVSPCLLCLGAPLTLAARATALSPDSWRLPRLRSLMIAYPVGFVLLYVTPWLPWSLSGYAPHVLTELLFLGLGLVVFWVLAGVDPLPRPVPWPARVRLLAVVTAVHVVLGAYLILGPRVGGEWFDLAAPPGVPDVPGDQRLAGAVAMLLPLTALAVLGVRMAWLRMDALARVR
ncbi:cytochrome c oxidase assembly protein [Nonomuraea roseoviolacea subsp. roseoviolacea]|uniref:bifunctional copper resistance protein CopD/cytochrome c oxidase assembly protein n=1 Tax=Nonomuraea roseoviolacea TaxID=103837 RepID=UPI0031D02960